MPGEQPIAVRVTETGLPPHDPLALYARMREELPGDEVFLFESEDGEDAGRRWAAVGIGRLAEMRVFGDRVELDGAPGPAALAAGALGLEPVPSRPRAHRARLTDRCQVWDLLSRFQRLFSVECDAPPDTYAFGFLASFSYESAWHMESLPERTGTPRGPDITLTLFRDTVWYDLASGEVRLLHADSAAFPDRGGTPDAAEAAWQEAAGGRAAEVPGAPAPYSTHDSVSRETFLRWADRCLEHIGVGDIYQIQIGHRVDVRTSLTPLDVYRRLRHRNPSPYRYLVPRAGGTLIGASPRALPADRGRGDRDAPHRGHGAPRPGRGDRPTADQGDAGEHQGAG